MDRNAAWLLAPLGDEAESVLGALAEHPGEGLRLNYLVTTTGLPTGHVGRHLRTLERHGLVRYGSGAWSAAQRGLQHARRLELTGAAA